MKRGTEKVNNNDDSLDKEDTSNSSSSSSRVESDDGDLSVEKRRRFVRGILSHLFVSIIAV